MSNDRISRLPEHIIHHILSSIPVKDAGRTCILSKDWKTVCTSYNILPSLHYDHNSFASELLLSGQEPEIYEIRDKFMDFADNNLVRINHDKSPVVRLILDVVVIRDEFSRVDQLMDIVGKTKVDELCISVQTKDSRWYSRLYDDIYEEEEEDEDEYVCYEFPYASVLASKQLQSLSITWCKFMGNKRTLTINKNNVNVGMFSSLKQLCLSRVILNEEGLNNIGSCCPGIEYVEFEFCMFLFESLKLSKFPKLKKAYIESEEFRRLLDVDCIGTKLESFYCRSDYLKWVINPNGCSNIRKLQLGYLSVNDPSLFEDLSTTFPLMEKAELTDIRGVNTIKANNFHLRKLKLHLRRFNSVKKIYVDCPNLRDFEYDGYVVEEFYIDCPKLSNFWYYENYDEKIPTFTFFDVYTSLRHTSFNFSVYSIPNTSWFIGLKMFLKQIQVHINNVSLHLDVRCSKLVDFVLDEFGAAHISRQNLHLEVQMPYARDIENSTAFVDGFMWSTCPTTLSTYGYCYDFVKYLCGKLADKKSGKESCCEPHLCSKYWWHNIEDFEVKHQNKDMKEELTFLPEMYKDFQPRKLGLCFEFQWRSIERTIAMYLIEMHKSPSTTN